MVTHFFFFTHTHTHTQSAMIPVRFDSETVVVKLGPDGSFTKEYSSKSFEDTDCIVLVLDPRKSGPHYYQNSHLKQYAAKLKVVVLLPSTTSSKECLMKAEVSLLCCCVASTFEGAEKLFVRMDDYLAHGDGIISSLISAGKTVYPAEEAANLKAMVDATIDSIFSMRAFAHWPVGMGGEEGEIIDFFDLASEVFSKDDCSLPTIEQVPTDAFLTTEALYPDTKPTFYYAFNEETTNSLKAELDVTVNLMSFPGPDDFDSSIVDGTPGLIRGEPSESAVFAASGAAAGWCAKCSVKLPTPCGHDKVVDEDDDPLTCQFGDCKRDDIEMQEGDEFSLCASCKSIGVCKACYVDLPEGEAKDAALKNMVTDVKRPEPSFTGKAAVFLLDLEKDISNVPPPNGYDGSGICAALAWLGKLREYFCDTSFVVIIMAESYESLATNIQLVPSMYQLTENVDIVLFCLKSDTEHIKAFCCGSKSPNESIFKVFNHAMTPFPRMHFYVFSNAMGRDIEDGSILGPTFTISDSPAGASIDTSKYATSVVNPHTNKTTGLFTLPNAEGSFANDRVLPGAPGTNTTLMCNGKFLMSLFESIKGENPKDENGEEVEGGYIKEKFRELGGFADEFITDTLPYLASNMMDQSSEYKAYLEKLVAEPPGDY